MSDKDDEAIQIQTLLEHIQEKHPSFAPTAFGRRSYKTLSDIHRQAHGWSEKVADEWGIK